MTLHLVANSACEMADLKRYAIAEAIRMVSPPSCGVVSPTPPTQNAITISLECWRDENNKLHCKLSVSLSAA